jgi:hypothetical protein
LKAEYAEVSRQIRMRGSLPPDARIDAPLGRERFVELGSFLGTPCAGQLVQVVMSGALVRGPIQPCGLQEQADHGLSQARPLPVGFDLQPLTQLIREITYRDRSQFGIISVPRNVASSDASR